MTAKKNARKNRRTGGGQPAIRGYLIQTLIALLEGLVAERPFDKLTLEPNHASEKFDVLWERKKATYALQVKSSANPFGEADVRRWAAEMEASAPANEYRLCLVGLPTTTVAKLKHVGNVILEMRNLDLPAFREQAAHRLDRFLRAEGLEAGTPEDREMLADALTARLAAYSTTGTPLTRGDLVDLLRMWVSEAPKKAPHIATTKLRHGAGHLVGRERELARLEAVWHDPGTHVVSVVAWGGVGKTALVVEWMARMAKAGWRGAERVFDWSFYSQGTSETTTASSDQFVARALEFFGDPELAESAASPWDKGERLAQLVAERRALLVLDGVEPLQYPPGPMAGKLKDRALEALLKGLAQHNAGLCLVTTRETLTDLAPWQDTTSPKWDLEHLSDEAGAHLLFQAGVRKAGNAQIEADDQELKDAAAEVNGHALTLRLLGNYLKLAHDGDVRKRDLVTLQEADPEFKTSATGADESYGHAFKIMATCERWLTGTGAEGKRQLAVLHLLGLFDRPADAACLAALRRKPVIRGLTKPLVGLTEAQWNTTLSRLEDCGIVAVHTDESATGDAPSTVDAHPLVREYFGTQLRNKRPKAWQAAHRRLYEHLTTSTEHLPKTVVGLEPLFQAAAHGCLAGSHQETLTEVLRERIWRRTPTGRLAFFSTKELGTIGAELAVLAHFCERRSGQPTEKLDEPSKALIMHATGFRFRVIARWTDAAIALHRAQRAYEKLTDWKEAADCAGNLNEVCIAKGHLAEALQHARASVALADRGEPGDAQWHRRAGYARVLHLMGDSSKAEAVFREAESILQSQAEDAEWLYSLAGFYYCDFLLDGLRDPRTSGRRNRLEEVKAKASAALNRAGKYLRDIALHKLILGRAYLLEATGRVRRIAPEQKQYLDDAVDRLKRAMRNDHLCDALLVRAAMRENTGDLDGAEADLDEAWQIAERESRWLHMADVLLHRARLFRSVTPYPWDKDKEGNPHGPKDDLAEAKTLIDRHGYHRRDEELADGEQAAKDW